MTNETASTALAASPVTALRAAVLRRPAVSSEARALPSRARALPSRAQVLAFRPTVSRREVSRLAALSECRRAVSRPAAPWVS